MSTTSASAKLQHYFGGGWKTSKASEYANVVNPATMEVLSIVPMASNDDVEAAVQSAAAAFPEWRRTPPEDRIQYLFKLKNLFEDHIDEIAKVCTSENGKTVGESKAEIRRAVENVEVACGIPTMMQGYNLEDVASGIDEMMIRQPLGVVVAITPFNFPAMIPFWFLPYAIATGNTFILKPSEKVPLTMQLMFELMESLKLPPGVLNLLHGGKDVVNGLLKHPKVRAISFVGSTPTAQYIYETAAKYGKRVQCQGGAKNHVVVMEDADMDSSPRIISDSAFGCAGQRCLAVSVAVTVGDARKEFSDSIAHLASTIKVGNGLDEGVQMGPVINNESKMRIEDLIGQGAKEGGKLLLDGRTANDSKAKGSFLRPTIIDGLPANSSLYTTEIFGPVLSLVNTKTLDEAIEFLSWSPYGNMASIFTTSGAAARKFRYEAPAGNIGVNIGVAAPMAYFPFSGWGGSFLGDLHGQGKDSIEFYTDKKVVVERWPKTWSRKF